MIPQFLALQRGDIVCSFEFLLGINARHETKIYIQIACTYVHVIIKLITPIQGR